MRSVEEDRGCVLSTPGHITGPLLCDTPVNPGRAQFSLGFRTGPKILRGPSRWAGRATSLAAVTATFENVGPIRASLPPPGRAYILARGYGGVGRFPRSRAPQTFYMLTILALKIFVSTPNLRNMVPFFHPLVAIDNYYTPYKLSLIHI